MLTDNPDYAKIKEIAKGKYPKACLLGLEDLGVEWIRQGSKFRVDEYDGSEYIVHEDHLMEA